MSLTKTEAIEKNRYELQFSVDKATFDAAVNALKEILASMEMRGIKIDTAELNRLSRQFEERINELTGEIYKESGEEFNINSTKQIYILRNCAN